MAVEILRENPDRGLFTPLGSAQHANSAWPALCDEEIAARRDPDEARVVEIGVQELNHKPRRRIRPGIRRTRHDRRAVVGACGRIWWRHIRRRDFAPQPRSIAAPVAISCGAS